MLRIVEFEKICWFLTDATEPVDFTTNEDNFLILAASIILNNRSVPVYFTMRNYPKKSGQYDHKKMERAFIKGLKHALSKKYMYVIVADRGFGNKRFINILEENGFEYLIRTSSKKRVVNEDNEGMMGDICAKDKHYHLKTNA